MSQESIKLDQDLQDLLEENERQHEEYQNLLLETRELCNSLLHKFEEFADCMNKFGGHMSRYADKMN